MSVFADILVLAALIAAAWLGAKRGLLKSLAGLLIVVVALLGDEATGRRPPVRACHAVGGTPGDPAGGAEN